MEKEPFWEKGTTDARRGFHDRGITPADEGLLRAFYTIRKHLLCHGNFVMQKPPQAKKVRGPGKIEDILQAAGQNQWYNRA